MERLNSGDSFLELWNNHNGWIPFQEAYLTEATEYKLRYNGNPSDVRIQGIPLPFYHGEKGYLATFITPFQSGSLNVTVNGQGYETYIFPDSRKLTEEQFNQMLEDILEEANSCFQLSGLEINVDSTGRSRDISWTQWSYLDKSFHQLRQIFNRIQRQPFRSLEKLPLMMKREKVERTERVTLRWLDQKGHGKDIPLNVHTIKTFETTNVYENQVLKQQVHLLYRLLRKYEMLNRDDVARKARRYKLVVQRWINSPFLKDITENQGPFTITQKFRKHPVYRMWYQWFDQLYKHERTGIGFDYPISLKDTFQLYEMWCYMQLVKLLREAGYVQDTRELYKTTREGIFLDLAENQESRIHLLGGMSLYFQRSYQYNSKTFHTYTQRMIPDIVLEGATDMIVFDPKYRVPDNLGTALGEMHKYRDGIIHRDTGSRAVKGAYILTPTHENQVETMRYFQNDFQEMYQMGAIKMVPGEIGNQLKRKVEQFIEKVSV
ncbi:DUF2357 domain-containing protein [Alkalihalobacterium alkalinitrilicum]|uniref:DUF2357 domain-containing protein n=1 Tax=Alkalihalobacterium alkalinitrilicum TaxID=427920 RepID=UPI00099549D6|nr:DUF2357 domain-containing protein [Alkalihalobacterium alkalinitrilicum]